MERILMKSLGTIPRLSTPGDLCSGTGCATTSPMGLSLPTGSHALRGLGDPTTPTTATGPGGQSTLTLEAAAPLPGAGGDWTQFPPLPMVSFILSVFRTTTNFATHESDMQVE